MKSDQYASSVSLDDEYLSEGSQSEEFENCSYDYIFEFSCTPLTF